MSFIAGWAWSSRGQEEAHTLASVLREPLSCRGHLSPMRSGVGPGGGLPSSFPELRNCGLSQALPATRALPHPGDRCWRITSGHTSGTSPHPLWVAPVASCPHVTATEPCESFLPTLSRQHWESVQVPGPRMRHSRTLIDFL